MDDPLVLLLAGVCLVVTGVAFWCARDMRHRYRDVAKGRVWDMFFDADLRAVVAGVLMVSIIVYSLMSYAFDWPIIPRPWGVVGIAFGYLLHQAGPIRRWITLWRIERGKV